MAPPGNFVKFAPADTTTGQPAGLTLVWGTSSGASTYEYCLDQTDNDACDLGSWAPTGANTNVFLSNLLPSVTYSWQVRARNTIAVTEGGPWWTFSRTDSGCSDHHLAERRSNEKRHDTSISGPPPLAWWKFPRP